MSKDETNYCTMQLSAKCKKKKGMLPLTEFYTSSNTTFYNNGKFNICKHCLKEYIYVNDEIDIQRFKTILRIFNIPFYEKDYKSAYDSGKETIGTYMKNLLLNHKGETWADGELYDTAATLGDAVQVASEDIKQLAKTWGRGYSEEDLLWLEENYNDWVMENDCRKIAAKKLVRRICIKELELRKADERGEDTSKLEKSLLELMTNSNLTPKAIGNGTEDDGAKCWGEFIRDIEFYRPGEYFKDKKKYEDDWNIMDYYQRFILRPLKNLLLGSREFDKEFNVEDTQSLDE